MTRRERLLKNGLFFGVFVYYIGGFLGISEMTHFRPVRYRLDLPFENLVPFVPEAIWAYLLIYAFVAIPYIFIDDFAFFKKAVRLFLICITIHLAIFLIYPVEFHLRPPVDPAAGLSQLVVAYYYWLDRPYNCFPSMHISNAVMVALMMRRYRWWWGWILLPMAGLVTLSVVLVKQHFIVDAVAGIGVGWLVYWWVFERPSRYSPQSPSSFVSTQKKLNSPAA